MAKAMDVDAPARLSHQYRLDDLLTEHFGFAPKAFTGPSPTCRLGSLLADWTRDAGHAFDLINDAVFDTVSEVEVAANERWPGQPEAVQLGLHKLETLLCSAVDKHFDLFEIWLHRNIFNFKPDLARLSRTGDQGLEYVRLAHQGAWEDQGWDWERGREEEAGTWKRLGEAKKEWLDARDDHLSLLAVSAALDRRLAALRAADDELAQLASSAKTSAASNVANLPDRVGLLVSQVEQLLDAHEALRASEGPASTAAAPTGSGKGRATGRMRKKEGFVNWAAARKVDATQEAAAAAGRGSGRAEPDRELGAVKAEMQGIGKEEGAKVRPFSHLRIARLTGFLAEKDTLKLL